MKILIIEDEHTIAAAVRKGLEQERFSVDVAYTGTDGYDLASTEPYDVILLDILLPGMDGVTVCRKLRSHDIHTPIIMLTARGQLEDKVSGFDSGADDYLTKPFAFEELLARIRAISRRPKSVSTSVLTVGDLSLDPRTFVVKRHGTVIPLSNREFSLLEYLMRHPSQVLSKQQIISHVWNYDADILPNTVEVNIKNLRNKIDIPFAQRNKALIQTIRGFGYKLEV